MKEVKTTRELLMYIGVPAHIKGFKYCLQALNLFDKDINYLDCIVKRLYADLGKFNNDDTGHVERAIRHAVEGAIVRGNKAVISDIFCKDVTLKDKVCNSEFLATLFYYCKENNITFSTVAEVVMA